MEENVENLEIMETTETTIEVIDYSPTLERINENLALIQDGLSLITLVIIAWFILQNFIFKKGWTK